jgi:cytochrome oxidase Cu insertion factor (SCO1/SenC/PrrC family)
MQSVLVSRHGLRRGLRLGQAAGEWAKRFARKAARGQTLTRSLGLGLALALLPAASPATSAGGDFELTDQNGEPWSTQSARGQVVLLSFGYTFCPDICPTTLATINAALKQLGDDAERVQPVFISLDPERDTPERLHEYVNWFNPRLIGLTGSAETLRQVADRYRVRYARVQTDGTDYYTLDHSASLYLLDRNGELARMLPHGLPVDALVDAIAQLLHEGDPPSSQ